MDHRVKPDGDERIRVRCNPHEHSEMRRGCRRRPVSPRMSLRSSGLRILARAMTKRSRGAPALEFLLTNATICLPETKREAERRKRHVARMSVSEVRGGHSSFQLVPGFHGACHRAGHFGPDPLVHPGYKFIRLQRREAERRQTRISNLRTLNLHPRRFGEDRGGGAARVHRDALACRRSTAALA